jgi:hypothetical protein
MCRNWNEPEHAFDGRIRQGSLVELGGDMDTARQI